MSCSIYEKFLLLKAAMNNNSEDIKDLPGLLCGSCGKLTHFGRCQNLLENDFTFTYVCCCDMDVCFTEG